MSDSEDFDWHRHAEDVAVPEQLQIACYTNGKGDVVIRQAGWPEDDDVIICAPQNALALARAILRAAGLEDVAIAAPCQLAPKDPTAAARQKRYRERNADRNGDRNAERNGHAPLLIEGRA